MCSQQFFDDTIVNRCCTEKALLEMRLVHNILTPYKACITASVESLAIWCVCLLAALALQWRSGTYSSEFGGFPDEAAHYVTGLMVHDYLANALCTNPKHFAESYYVHYPKVAIGHWPPVFYVVQAVHISLFGESRASLLACVAMITATYGTTIYWMMRTRHGRTFGLVFAVLTVCLPTIQWSTSRVMPDVLVALLVLWAALWFARYLRIPTCANASLFGVFAALAILTKGNGLLLGLLPPLAITLGGRWRLAMHVSFWIPAIIVFFATAPWFYATAGMPSLGMPPVSLTVASVTYGLMNAASSIMSLLNSRLLFVAAISGALLRLKAAAALDSLRLSMLSLLFATLLFHAVVANFVEPRYHLCAIAPLLLFVSDAVESSRTRLLSFGLRPFVARVLPSAVVLTIFLTEGFSIPQNACSGFADAWESTSKYAAWRTGPILVCSDDNGEGMFISRIAMTDDRPNHIVLRGSKMLASVDWSREKYQSRFTSCDDMNAWLKESGVGIVVTDASTLENTRQDHCRVLADALVSHPDDWAIVGTFPRIRDGATRPDAICVYRSTQPSGRNMDGLRIPMRYSLGRDLIYSAPASY